MENTLTPRERFANTLLFKPTDRVPLIDWAIRGATMNEWLKQGYPEGVDTNLFFNLDPFGVNFPINMEMLPKFEPKTIETDGEYKIWRDELGAVRKDFIVTENEGFVTRSWLSFAVTDRDSFLDMKKRYVASDANRVSANFFTQCEVINKIQNHSCTTLRIPFLYWVARDWIGFNDLNIMFYEEPALLEEIFEFITDFSIETLKDKLPHMELDYVELLEDMAYKGAPMIGPDMFRKFMLPHYKRMVDFLRSNGVKFISVDCDGYPEPLIPLWIDAGVDALSPTEIAAGCDPIVLREKYPSFTLLGGIDKRELSKDKRAVYREVMSKVPYLLEKGGGFIPHVDHAVPHNVPFANYKYFRELLACVAKGSAVEEPREC